MILIINGSSGSGKTTIGEYLENIGWDRVITSTTREMRQGEINHKSYHFISLDEFNSREFIEKSCYSNNYYGTEVSEVEKYLNNGKDLFAVLDINGVKAFKAKFGDKVKVIYVKTSGNKVKRRMKMRGDSLGKIRERIKFRRESNEFENESFADIVINNNFSTKYLKKKVDEAIEKLKNEEEKI